MSSDIQPGAWGVLASYGFPVVEITRVSEQCFWSRGGKHRGDREVRTFREKLVCWSADKGAAELASKRLVSAEGERDRRLSAARVWFAKEKEKVSLACKQGLGARLATLEAGRAQGEGL